MSKAYFDQVASRWETMRKSMFGDDLRQAALERAGLSPQAVAVDLGAGAGFLARGLAPLVSRVHVIDFSLPMLEEARRNLADFSNVEYHLAEGERLPLPDESVDAVLANMYLHHAPHPPAAIREMARLLRPGGRMVITDLDEHAHAFLREEQGDLWPGFRREELYAWLKEAGLVNLRVEDTGQSCSSRSEGWGEEATVSVFAAVGMKAQPEMQQAVQDLYRQVARGASSSCCGPINLPIGEQAIPLEVLRPQAASCCPPAAPGSSSFLAQEPGEAELYLGCGNPVGLASLRPGEVVLDIGSGAGADVFPAARRVGPQGRVIGLDMLEEMLARARATAQAHGYSNVEFRQGDAQAIPLEDDSVDVVMSNCVINLVQDKGQAFREAYRVLKPGGRLSISDIVTDRPFSPSLRSDANSWSACVSGALPEAEYLALIAQVGFDQITTARSQPWIAEDGTQVYSLNITAVKG